MAHASTRRLAALALAAALASCEMRCGSSATPGSSGFAPMAVMRGETWVIDGRREPISATYYLAWGNELQYTIELERSFGRDVPSETQAQADALPFILYAYDHGLYTRSDIRRAGTGTLRPSWIGVAFVETKGVRSRGTRVRLSLAEIREKYRPVEPPSEHEEAAAS